MRTLASRRHEQAQAEADDRDLESRTDRRREQNTRESALKALAVRLVGLKLASLQRLALDERLLAAIREAQAMPSAPARNRQVNVVRQHLRELGPAAKELEERLQAPGRELAPSVLPAAAEATPPVLSADTRALSWRERLIAEGDSALEELLAIYPAADRQLLRQRMREAAKAQRAESAGASQRANARLQLELERILGLK